MKSGAGRPRFRSAPARRASIASSVRGSSSWGRVNRARGDSDVGQLLGGDVATSARSGRSPVDGGRATIAEANRGCRGGDDTYPKEPSYVPATEFRRRWLSESVAVRTIGPSEARSDPRIRRTPSMIDQQATTDQQAWVVSLSDAAATKLAELTKEETNPNIGLRVYV